MPLSAEGVKKAVGMLLDARDREQPRLKRIDRALADGVYGQAAGVYVPRRATREYRMLVEQSRFNVLDLVVTSVAQNLFVDGFRPTGPNGRAPTTDNSPIWDAVWQPNRMDARQAALYRAAIRHGTSYALVLPGDPEAGPEVNGKAVPAITPMSACRMTALYEDPANDEWPELALEVQYERAEPYGAERRKVMVCRLFDDEFVYTIEVTSPGELDPRVTKVEEHGLTVVPVVRFRDRYDLGVPCGKVEPLLWLQQQVNQITFSLAMALQYAAFRQRYVTGMEPRLDAAGNELPPLFNVAVDQILTGSSPDMKFGEFSQPLALDTPVPSPSGWLTIGQVAVGDEVLGRDGRPATVLGMSPILFGQRCYRITFADGSSVVADAAHRWCVKDRFRPSWGEMVRTTAEMADQVRLAGARPGWRWAVPQAKPLELKPADLPVHPYLLGYWLGDGSTQAARITVGDGDRADVIAEIEGCGYRVVSSRQDSRTGAWDIHIGTVRPEHGTRIVYTAGCRCQPCRQFNASRARARKRHEYLADPGWSVQRHLRDLDVLGNKHIPPRYLRASFQQRLDLLRGLLDSDGCINRTPTAAWCVFTNTNETLVEGIIELARTLGLRPTCHWYDDAGTRRKIASVGFQAPGEFVPFALRRKASLCPSGPKSARQHYRSIVSIEEVESVPVRCLAVDTPDHLFLVGKGFIPTHNTDVSGYLESRDKVLLHIASVAQIPPQNLVVGSGISNVPAEALELLAAGHRQDIAEHQVSFGESIEQTMRLAGKAMDDTKSWEDMSAQVVWRDTTLRSPGQVVDALGKGAQMLSIPPKALWEKWPGVTDQDLQRWRAMADEEDGLREAAMAEAVAPPLEPPDMTALAGGNGGVPARPAKSTRPPVPAGT